MYMFEKVEYPLLKSTPTVLLHLISEYMPISHHDCRNKKEKEIVIHSMYYDFYIAQSPHISNWR